VFHMNFLRLNAFMSDASSSNHSPSLRLEAHLEVPLPLSTLWASGQQPEVGNSNGECSSLSDNGDSSALRTFPRSWCARPR
jgi:hypothetical protein